MSAGIRAGSSNDGYVQVNGNDIITALSGGNVGIGVSSPSTKLHVNGTITATNFAGSGGITTDDWIVHAGDTDTKLGFSGADTISFHTAGAEVLKIGSTGNLELPRNNDYVKIGSGGALNFVHTGSGAFISNSSGFLTHQCDTHQWKKGDGSAEYFRSTATGVAIGHVGPVRRFSVKSSDVNTVAIALLDNDSTNEIWRVGQAADGDGYVEVLEDGGTVGCKLDASGNSFTMGNFGIGVASPSGKLEIDTASSTTMIMLDVSGTNFARIGHNSSSGTAVLDVRSEGHTRFLTGGNNERLRIASTGEILIGGYTTFSSYTKLQVRGATSGISDGGQIFDVASTATATGGTRLAIGVNEDNYTWIRSYESGVGSRDMILAGSTERLRITDTGRIDILGDGGNAGFTLSNKYGQAGIFGGMYYNGSSWTRNAIGTRKGAGMYVNTGGHIAFLTSTETSGTSATVTESVRITDTGNLQQTSSSGVSWFKGSSEYIFGSSNSSPPSGGTEAKFQVHDYKTRATMSLNGYMNNGGAPVLEFISSRSGTPGTLGTKAALNDYHGDIRFYGDNGTNYNSLVNSAQILVRQKSTISDGDTVCAGEMSFYTGSGTGGSVLERLKIDSGGRATFTGEVHISDKLVHDGDQDTYLSFGANTLVLKAGNRTAINCNSTMTEISSPVQYNNSRNYSTNSTSSWTTIFTFSVAGCPGFSFECGVRENNYTTIHRVGGSAQWNNCYSTNTFAGDSGHSHSKDITFRVLNDGGTKRLQFKAIQYTTTRTLSVISVWVASGYVTWA